MRGAGADRFATKASRPSARRFHRLSIVRGVKYALSPNRTRTGRHHVARLGVASDRRLNGTRAIGRRDAGRHALRRLDADGERGSVLRAVAVRHERQVEQLATFLRERETDQAAAVARHEVDRFRRHEFGGEHQIALVFAIFFVDEDHHPAGFEFGDDLWSGGERHVGEFFGESAYFTPRAVPSRLRRTAYAVWPTGAASPAVDMLAER